MCEKRRERDVYEGRRVAQHARDPHQRTERQRREEENHFPRPSFLLKLLHPGAEGKRLLLLLLSCVIRHTTWQVVTFSRSPSAVRISLSIGNLWGMCCFVCWWMRRMWCVQCANRMFEKRTDGRTERDWRGEDDGCTKDFLRQRCVCSVMHCGVWYIRHIGREILCLDYVRSFYKHNYLRPENRDWERRRKLITQNADWNRARLAGNGGRSGTSNNKFCKWPLGGSLVLCWLVFFRLAQLSFFSKDRCNARTWRGKLASSF